jgi:hypothetical protein
MPSFLTEIEYGSINHYNRYLKKLQSLCEKGVNARINTKITYTLYTKLCLLER